MNRSFISFPEGRLGEAPRRLSVLASGPDWFALEKPPGVPAVRDGFARGGTSLVDAILEAIDAGKNQLRELEIKEVFPVAYPDSEIAGILLCARTEAARQALKNAMGASQFGFTHRFLTAAAEDRDEILCQLPLAHPEKSARMLVSHAVGKKTETRFRKIRRMGEFTLWEAFSAYSRRHQVKLHAFEIGLPVLGDRLYARSEPVYLSSLKRGYRSKGPEQPLYRYPGLFQTQLRFPDPESGQEVVVEASPPRRLTALMNQVERQA
jgi:23S rRNA-/tRNA-specific pseudouridylate synthase